MTNPSRYFDDVPPQVEVDPLLRTAAGMPAVAVAVITNRAHEPRVMAMMCLGVDPDWLPEPSRSRPLMPGESMIAEITLQPAIGTLPARYPLAVTVQALDPASGEALSSIAIADVTVIVDAPGQIEVAVAPAEASGRLRAGMSITLRNTGRTPENVRLEVRHPEVARVVLAADEVHVPAGGEVVVKGKIAVRARVFGHRSRFTYTVSARGSAAPRRAEGAIVTRSILGANGPKAFALVALVAIWAVLAVVLIPKLSSHVAQTQNKAANQVSGLQNKAQSNAPKSGVPGLGGKSGTTSGGSSNGSGGGSGSGSGGGSGSSSGSGGSSSGSGSGSGGGSGSTSGGSNASPDSSSGTKLVQLSGTIAGQAPSGVRVTMNPTSLVDQAVTQAHVTGIGVDTSSFTQLGKIPESALTLPAPSAQSQNRATKSSSDGAWAFTQVRSPGYYLLVFTKPGYQTQRYVLDSSSAAATQPLTVTLTPGQGRLSGRITDKSGSVGGATISISDGTNTVTTSSNSKGDVGKWSVDGLSTPSSYLVSATKNGLSSESRIVALTAGSGGVADLELTSAATTLIGKVERPKDLEGKKLVGLGGAEVSVSDGKTSRAATTITDGNLVGTYRLPNLAPGTYTVTTTSVGYLTQTQQITVVSGHPQKSLETVLTSSSALVAGTVKGVQFDPDGNIITDPATGKPKIGPLNGAGLILDSPKQRYKTTSAANGSFTVSGIAPGNYVVSAQYAGLTTAFTNITVRAGHRTDNLLLQLGVATTPESSTIIGFVTSATSPAGTVNCPPGTSSGVDCFITLTLRDSTGASVLTRTSGSGKPKESPTVNPVRSGPTGYTLSADPGLAPGLYQLTVGATGYLPATVGVRVPANRPASAPQVNLFPSDTIQGTVTYLSDPGTDGPAAGVPYTTCTYAIPIDSASGPPANCSFTPPATSACQTRGQAETGFAKLAADGSYRIPGLCDGTYLVYVVPTNPWFLTSVPGYLSVTHGETADYSPHLVRKGRVLISLSVYDPVAGDTSPANNLTGSATCGGSSFGDLAKPDQNGDVVVEGVTASDSASCTISAQDSGTDLSGSITGLTVSNDNDTSADVTLTQQVGDVFGRLSSSYGDNTDHKLGGVSITLTGIVGFDGSTPRYSDPVTVVTDPTTGCFAIGTSDADVDGGADCGTIAKGAPNRAELKLVSQFVKVHVSGVPGYQDLDADVALPPATDTIVELVPRPIDSSGLLVQSSSATDLSAVQVSVTPLAAAGAGQLTASVTQTGTNTATLTFNDNTMEHINQLTPGTYTVTATLDGFGSDTETLTCGFNAASCTMPTVKLSQLGALSGQIIGIQGEALTYDAGNGVNTYPSHPINGATVKAVKCGSGESSPNCTGTPTPVNTDVNGNFGFGTTAQPFVLATGNYQITVSAPGYTTYVQSVTIGSGANSLPRNYLFTAPVNLRVGIQIAPGKLFSCPVANPSCATITAQRVETGQSYSVSAASATDKRYVLSNLNPATYLITITGDGLSQTSTEYTIPLGSTAPLDVSVPITRNTISGSVTGPVGKNATPTPLNSISVELGHVDGTGFHLDTGTDANPLVLATIANAGVDGSFTFANVPNGSYVARINHGYTDPDDASKSIAANDNYGSVTTSFVVSVFNGQSSNFGTIALPQATHDVTFSITTTADADNVTSATPTLTSKDDSTYVLTPLPVTTASVGGGGHGNVDTWKFSGVPAGKWTIGITLPAGHLGTLTATQGPALTSCSTTATYTVGAVCASSAGALTVPGGSGTVVNPAYTLDEYAVGVSVVAKKLATDPNVTPPATVALGVKDGATTVYTNAAFAVSATAPATPTDSFWGATGSSYAVKTTSAQVNWTAADVTLTKASPSTPISLVELGEKVTVHVGTLSVPTSQTASVTLVPPTGSGITAPAAQSVLISDHDVVFNDVPFGTGWTAKADGSYVVPPVGAGNPTTVTFTGSTNFDVTAVAPQTVNVNVS